MVKKTCAIGSALAGNGFMTDVANQNGEAFLIEKQILEDIT